VRAAQTQPRLPLTNAANGILFAASASEEVQRSIIG
jgi:hypothetical protein